MILVCLLLLIAIVFFALRRGGRDPADASLKGIWRQATSEQMVGYLYFSRDGAVYYMASKIPATEAMFTEKFRVAEGCSGQGFSHWHYELRERECGGLLLCVTGEAIGGTYYKIYSR